jgi:meso-butanediol dehydrogenase/(S,S)-butanediol dehydrogenase/diacetyl reductase
MTALPLAARTGLVPGCGRRRGLGRAIALELARCGADVAVADVPRTEEAAGSGQPWPKLESLAAEIERTGRRRRIVTGDVGSASDAARMVAEASALGRVDILVNNAAAPHEADRDWTWQVSRPAWDEVLRTNATDAFLMSSAVVRLLLAEGAGLWAHREHRLGGRLRGLPQRAAYSAAKFALIGLTQSIAWELASRRITVNAVCPGTIQTDRHEDRIRRQPAQRGPERSTCPQRRSRGSASQPMWPGWSPSSPTRQPTSSQVRPTA